MEIVITPVYVKTYKKHMEH